MESVFIYGIIIVTFVLTFVQGYFLDRMSNNGIFYGVRVPEKYKDIEELKKVKIRYKKRYLIIMLPVFIIAFLGFFITKRISILLIDIFIIIFLNEVIYYFSWKEVKRLKVKNDWGKESKNMVVIDIKGGKERKERGAIEGKYFLYLSIFPIIAIILLIAVYSKVPENIPTHFNIEGVPDAFAKKGTIEGILNYVALPFMQFFIIIVFYFNNKYSLLYKKLLNGGKIQSLKIKQETYRRYMSIYLFVIAFEIVVLFSILEIAIFHPAIMKIITIPAIIIIMGSTLLGTIILFRIGQGGKNIKVNYKDNSEIIYRDDDSLYFLGKYYYNKEDPSIMIQKRMGIGTDFNYGNRIAQVIVIGVIIMLIAIIIMCFLMDPSF